MYELYYQIKDLSDEKKEKSLKKLNINKEVDYITMQLIIYSISDDDKKIELINQLREKDRIRAYETLQSDEKKYLIASQLDMKKYDVADLIKSINSDDIKIKSLNLFTREHQSLLKEIIKSIESDDLKIKMMKKYLYSSNFVDVLMTLKSDEKKVEMIELVKYDLDLYGYIKTIKNIDDKTRMKIIPNLKDESCIIELACDLKDKNLKIKAMEYLNVDTSKAIVIKTFKPNERIEMLNLISNIDEQTNIIDSIDNDADKLKNINLVKSENTRTRIIETLEDDNKKIKYYKTLRKRPNKILIATSLKSDEKKIKLANQYKDPIEKSIIQMSIKDKENFKKVFLPKNRKYKLIGLKNDTTIGIEIESFGFASEYILKQGNFFPKNNDGKNLFENWSSKIERSVFNGVEVTSPILKDSKEQVEEIYAICEMLKRVGQKTDAQCGGHIHIGFSALKENELAVDFLKEMYVNTEKIMYIISNEAGQIPRERVGEFADPIGKFLTNEEQVEAVDLEIKDELEHRNLNNKTVGYIENNNLKIENLNENQNQDQNKVNDIDKSINELKKLQPDRYTDMNFFNINTFKNTIEFRIPNGTLNSDVWIENIRLFGRLIEKSEELAEIYVKKEKTEEEKKLLKMEEDLTKDISEEEKLEKLLCILFSEDEREVYRERFEKNSKLVKKTTDESYLFNKIEFPKEYKVVREKNKNLYNGDKEDR